VAFKTIHNSQISKIIVMILIISIMILTFQPKQVDAFAITTAGAFIALVGVVVTAIAGYTYQQQYNSTHEQVDGIYDRLMSRLNESEQEEFITALGSFALTGIITENLIDQLKLGILGDEVIKEIQSTYNQVYSTFPQEAYTLNQQAIFSYLIDSGLNPVRFHNVAFNSRYLITMSVISNEPVQMLEINDGFGMKTSMQSPFQTSYTLKYFIAESTSMSLDYGFVFSVYDSITKNVVHIRKDTYGAYFPWEYKPGYKTVINNFIPNTKYYLPDGSIVNEANFFIPEIEIFPYNPSLNDIDIGTINIPVPVDVAVDIPTYPTEPAIDTVISIPIPQVATGDNVIYVPIDNTVAEPIDPTIPNTGIGSLSPTMPTDAILNFEPLMSTGLTSKFPFSIPFDMGAILNIFSGTSRTPLTFSLPFVQDIELNFDLSHFSGVAAMTRFFVYLIFLFALMILTKKMIF